MPGKSSLTTKQQENLRLLNALRESEFLRELTALLASSLDLSSILQVLIKRTTEVCSVERCAVWLMKEPEDQLISTMYHLSRPDLKKEVTLEAEQYWYEHPLPASNPIIRLLRTNNGLLTVENLAAEPGMRTMAEKFLVQSVLLVALVREGRLVGIMSLDNPGKTTLFTSEQQQLARAIGQQAAIAIGNAQLYEQAQTERKRAEQLFERAQSIYQVTKAVNSGTELFSVLDIATREIINSLNADGGAIALMKENCLSIISSTQLYPSTKRIFTDPSLKDLPHCYSVASNEKSAFVTNTEVEKKEKRWYRRWGLRDFMVIPLLLGTTDSEKTVDDVKITPDTTHCIGFVFINYNRCDQYPSPGGFAFAQEIATLCALAIEKDRILAEAHQAEALATQRANTLDAVFDAMTEGLIVLNLDGQVISSNKTASRFLGIPIATRHHLTAFLKNYPTHTLFGQSITQEDFPLSRALRGENIRGERFITTRADGSERTIEVNIAPLFDNEGNKTAIVSAFRDITEQIRVEQRIRGALETMLHAVEAVSGVRDIREILHKVLQMTLMALNCEYGIVQLYDSQRQTFTPLLSMGFPVSSRKKTLKKQATDDKYVTFRSQLLEGHATLIASEQCPHYPTSSKRNLVLAAPIMHNENLLGVMILDRTPIKVTLKDAGQGNIPFQAAKRDFTLWDMAVVEGIAQFAGLVIEEAHWQQEAEMARTNEAAMRESNALKDEFLAITAHEFRTPLTVILAHSQMTLRILRRTAENEYFDKNKLTESITIIEEQAHQLTNIVNTFLEVTRLNRGQITLKMEDVDLAEIARQAVSAHSATTNDHTITCLTRASSYPYLVQGDSARLLQIFANLLQNAIKYSPFGGSITVSLQQRKETMGKEVIEVCVEDHGIGIPLEAQPRLFERFYRAPNIEGSKTRGIGLGLYVVAELLRLHGGTILVESSGVLGEGSRFIFILPALERDISSVG